MRRALLIALALLVLLVIALPPAAVYYAAYTEAGLQLIARFIPRRIGNVRIAIDGLSGTVAHGIRIGRLDIDDTRVHLEFTDITGRVRLAPLLLQTIHVRQATLRHALVEVHPAPPNEPHRPPRRWHFLPHWLEIRVDEVRADSGTLIVPDGQRFDASGLHAAGLVRASTVRVDSAAMTVQAMQVSAHGMLRAANPLRLDATARATIRPARQPEWDIDASGKGDLNDIALAGRITAPFRAALAGHALELTRRWHISTDARVEDFSLRAWGLSDVLGRVTGRLALTADSHGFTAVGPLTAERLHAGAVDTQFDGAYANRAILVRRLTLTQPSGARVTASGEIGIVAHGPRLDLQGDWERLRWPLAARAAAVTSAAGRYSLHGMRPYALEGSGDLVVRGLQPIGFDMQGTLDEHALRVRAAALHAFDGRASGSGEIAWSPRPSWSAAGTAIDVSPVSLRRDLPGRVTFDFQGSGSRIGAGGDFTLAIRHLSGRLRRLRARADGTISRRGPVWQLTGVEAQLGRTALSLDGTVSDRVALDFELAADDLALIDPGIQGRLDARGNVHGPRDAPAIEASAQGSALRYRGLSLASFEAGVDFDPRRGRSQAHLRAHDLALGTRGAPSLQLDRIVFTLDGPPASQQASLTASGAGYRAEVSALGTLLDGAWRGELTRFDVGGANARLALEAPAAIGVAAAAFHLDRLCLVGKPARVCADADWTPRQWSAFALASGLPLELLTAGLTRDAQYRGLLGLTAQVGAVDRAPMQGSLGVTLTGTEMVHRAGDGHIETAQLGSGSLTVNAGPDRIDGEVQFGGGTAGSIKGRLLARRTSNAWRDMPLEGEITVHTSLREWAPLYTRDIDRVSGEASANLSLAGTLGTPLVNGGLAVRDAELDLYQYNLELRAAALDARLHDTGIDFDGQAHVGAGAASAHGHVEWRNGATFGRFALTGSSLRVVDIPEAQIDASPDLLFTLDGRRLNVAGAVTIPDARIAPAELTNAVHVSPDQVIVGEESDGGTGRLRVSTRLEIKLGNNVRIETQGLTGRLAGDVIVTSSAESITRASGELRIADGEYAAYGRRLDIDRGRLIYTASPLDNPGIDIRAVKRFHDPNVGATLAGINVRGTLRQPQITFFSEPPLAQQQIVSLVFAGGTLLGGPQLGTSAAANTSRNENAQLIGQGAAVLGSQIGLPVGIEPTYNNDTALMLGKYLSPRLYVSYGITLVQALNIVKLRYTLGDHWALSTELGQLGGADIVYTFQK